VVTFCGGNVSKHYFTSLNMVMFDTSCHGDQNTVFIKMFSVCLMLQL